MKHTHATSFEQRHQIQQRTARDEHLVNIAQDMHLGYNTVRKWAHRSHSDLTSYYGRPAHGALSTFAPLVRYVALRLKRENPQWGPNVILDAMGQRPSLKRRRLRLPHRAALARYYQQWPRLLAKRRARYPKVTALSPLRPTRVHEQWQYDFKATRFVRGVGVIALADLRDPVSGVTLLSVAHLVGQRRATRQVSLREIQADFRAAFSEWGLPERVKTDHQSQFYDNTSRSAFPSLFTFWLVGLGITHELGRPAHPTDQPQVERCHRTMNNLAVGNRAFTGLAALQRHLKHERERANARLPSYAADCQGRPPLVAHPEALVVQRPYAACDELHLFHLARVDAFLATQRWFRQVSDMGQVSLGAHIYGMGVAYKRQTVVITFDATDRHFVFRAEDETLIKRLPARGLEVSDITGLLQATRKHTRAKK